MNSNGRDCDLGAIKAAVDALLLVKDRYGIEFGANRKTHCPFPERHNNNDRSPSLTYHEGIFKCWSQECFGDKGVDVFGLVQCMDSVGLNAAKKIVADYADVKLSGNGSSTHQPARPVHTGDTNSVAPESEGVSGEHRIVASYEYQNRDGDVAYTIDRWEPKDFRARPAKVSKKDRVLYRLPDLDASDGPVVIVEGERKVDRLRELGHTATSCAFGSGAWLHQYAESLRSRDVIMWPDKDAPGEKFGDVVLASLEGVAASLRRVQPPDDLLDGGDVMDVLEADVGRLIAEAPTWAPADITTTDDDEADVDDDGAEGSKAERLVRLVRQEAELFHDQHQTPHAYVMVKDYSEVLRCKGRRFRQWASRLFYEQSGKVIASDQLSSALNVLEGIAVHDGAQYELQNRVAKDEKGIWIDTRRDGRAIRVNESGWETVDEPPILFTGYEHQKAQIDPLTGGDPWKIFDFVPVECEKNQLLLLTWMIACFVPDIPHPVLVAHGPQGSGKTSACRDIRSLIDPSSLGTMSLSRDNNELVQRLAHHYVAPFDNIDGLTATQSDMLCRASTGEGFSKRQLYTDDDDIIHQYRRCVILNGINIAATRPDLLDRAILIGLERIAPSERREEEELRAAFEEVSPSILGGMLDALSTAIRLRPSVELQALPRMADFARWGCAISEALEKKSKDFVDAYQTNTSQQNREVLDGQPVAAAVEAFMKNRTKWEGSPSELLAELEKVAEVERMDIKAKSWPKAPHILTRRLKEVQPNLAEIGILVQTGISLSHRRGIRIRTSSVGSDVASGALGDSKLDADAAETEASVGQEVASDGNSLVPNDICATDATDATVETTNSKRVRGAI